MAELALKERLAANAAALEKTGHLFGLESLHHKETDPGTYEAVWHILSNACEAAWATGCKVSSSPIAAEGGDTETGAIFDGLEDSTVAELTDLVAKENLTVDLKVNKPVLIDQIRLARSNQPATLSSEEDAT